jgi:hypothetical protein
MNTADLRIDATRLMARLDTLATIGRRPRAHAAGSR